VQSACKGTRRIGPRWRAYLPHLLVGAPARIHIPARPFSRASPGSVESGGVCTAPHASAHVRTCGGWVPPRERTSAGLGFVPVPAFFVEQGEKKDHNNNGFVCGKFKDGRFVGGPDESLTDDIVA
jgi:hypothetical protein